MKCGGLAVWRSAEQFFESTRLPPILLHSSSSSYHENTSVRATQTRPQTLHLLKWVSYCRLSWFEKRFAAISSRCSLGLTKNNKKEERNKEMQQILPKDNAWTLSDQRVRALRMGEVDMEKHAGWKQAAEPMIQYYFNWKIPKSFRSLFSQSSRSTRLIDNPLKRHCMNTQSSIYCTTKMNRENDIINWRPRLLWTKTTWNNYEL